MDQIRQIPALVDAVSSGNYTHEQVLDLNYVLQVAFLILYLLTSLSLMGNKFAGLNASILGLVLVLFTVYSYRVLRLNVTRTTYGIVLGASFMLVFILLQSAIFWGQYAGCVPSSTNVKIDKEYGDCQHTEAMKFLSGFSVLLFISYGSLIAIMIKHKNDILGSAPVQERGIYMQVPSNIPSNPIYALHPSPRNSK
jgi:hypothetical protein